VGATAHPANERLTSSGNDMRYKVYVVLTTDNEAGSNAVEVVRP
jgi:hypothetical protein